MKKIFTIIFAALMLCSCNDRIEILFDTPFCSISDETGSSSGMAVSNKVDGYLTVVYLKMSVSNNYFVEPISIAYDLIVGDGLKEGVDFEIQKTTRSPLTFDKGTYSKPIRILWYKNPDFDPAKDNTLTLEISSSTVPQMLLGYPGPDSLHKKFIFTKNNL